MKKLIFALFAAASVNMHADVTQVICGESFAVDTLQHYKAGPGLTHTHLYYKSTEHKFDIYLLTLDLDNAPDAGLKVILGQDSCNISERVSSMAMRHTTGTQQIIAGTNADFFITGSFNSVWGSSILGYPNMSCVIDGKIAAPDIIDKGSRENALIYDDNGGLWIDATDMDYTLLSEDMQTVIPMTAANFPRNDDAIVFYNSYAGKYTHTTAGGREIAVELAPGSFWCMNAPIKFVVKGKWYEGGCMAIPENGGVLSLGPGYANDWVDNLKEGDVINLRFGLSLPANGGITPDVRNVVGGDVRILADGEVVMEANRWINPRDSYNPRTMVGYSKDRKKVVICAIDGRSTLSSGTTYPQGAELMRNFGCWDALNFDGGGSTSMYLQKEGIVNNPSDGSERAVGNGLFIALNAPADNEITEIRFRDWSIVLPAYGTYKPTLMGYNRYGQLIDVDLQGFTLSCPEGLGEILPSGDRLFANGSGCHALTATFGDLSATIPVSIDGTNAPEPKYQSILIDNNRKYTVELQSLVKGQYMSVSPSAMAWESSDANVATISEQGEINGLADGISTITGSVGDQQISIELAVECPKEHVAAIDKGSDTEQWKITRTSVKTAGITPLDNGFGLDYVVSSTRGPKVTLSNDIRLWSLPDAIQVRINPGDVSIKNLIVTLRPDNATRSVSLSKSDIISGTENVLTFPISEFFDTDDIGIYPIHFASLALEHGGQTGSFHVDIPGIEVIYDNVEAGGIEDVVLSEAPASVMRPVVVDGRISLPTDAETIDIYDISGRHIGHASCVSSTEAPAASGTYIIRAMIAGRMYTGKIVI